MIWQLYVTRKLSEPALSLQLTFSRSLTNVYYYQFIFRFTKGVLNGAKAEKCLEAIGLTYNPWEQPILWCTLQVWLVLGLFSSSKKNDGLVINLNLKSQHIKMKTFDTGNAETNLE